MRKSFVATTIRLMEKHDNIVLLLGDISVHGFKEAFQRFPDRTFNIGILEQSTVSVAAGWALRGYVPIVHTIAPFLVERAFEQLKVDFGYQDLHGIFVGVGGSYDYASLGCTHHCPADVALLENIPNFTIMVPGNSSEAETSLEWAYSAKGPIYIRLSERENVTTYALGAWAVASGRSGPTVVGVGPVMDMVHVATMGLPHVNICYTNVLQGPFSAYPLTGPVVVVEPFYSSGLCQDLVASSWPKPLAVRSFSVPRRFIKTYGSMRETDESLGFTADKLRAILEKL